MNFFSKKKFYFLDLITSKAPKSIVLNAGALNSHQKVNKKQDLTLLMKANKKLKGNTALASSTSLLSSSSSSASSLSTSSNSYANSTPTALSQKSSKEEHIEAFMSNSGNYFQGYIPAAGNPDADTFYSNPAGNTQANLQTNDLSHIYYPTHHSNFLPNGHNYNNYTNNVNYNQQPHQFQSNVQSYHGNQQQYYYYPTPESSPDVQFQLLNDAVVLNAATQHLLTSSNNQNPFIISGTNNSPSNTSAVKRVVSNNDTNSAPTILSSTSSNLSSTSPSPSDSNPTYPNSFIYQSAANIHQSNRTLKTASMSSPNSNGLLNYSPYQYPNANQYNSIEVGQCVKSSNQGEPLMLNNSTAPTSNSSKLSPNWYISAAAAAAAVGTHLTTNSFAYSNEFAESQNNNYSNFNQKF